MASQRGSNLSEIAEFRRFSQGSLHGGVPLRLWALGRRRSLFDCSSLQMGGSSKVYSWETVRRSFLFASVRFVNKRWNTSDWFGVSSDLTGRLEARPLQSTDGQSQPVRVCLWGGPASAAAETGCRTGRGRLSMMPPPPPSPPMFTFSPFIASPVPVLLCNPFHLSSGLYVNIVAAFYP